MDILDYVKVIRLEPHYDDRGYLIECWRLDNIEYRPEMMYISWTKPQQKRGPHLHQRQTDIFIFPGPGLFDVYLWEYNDPSKQLRYHTGTVEPCLIIIPPGVVHGYKNISKIDGLVINCPDKLYKGWNKNEKEDIIRFEDDPNNPFIF